MQVFLTAYWLPKFGNTIEEYEDAFYPQKGCTWRGNELCFALADGASEGMLSKEWAELLVKVFFRSHPEDLRSLLDRSYQRWEKWREAYLRRRVKRGRPVQWFEEPGLLGGAFTTFLGLTFIDIGEKQCGRWKAIVVGDTCLFQVRGERLIAKFPLERSSDFTNRPFLISSNPGRNNRLHEIPTVTEGHWINDDRFYLMTDALACWFLKGHEAGLVPWSVPSDLDTRDEWKPFNQWIDDLRVKQEIRNDDVTLLRLDVV